jgi:hypothetical protein
VAVKVINPDSMPQFTREEAILKELTHDHIVQYLETISVSPFASMFSFAVGQPSTMGLGSSSSVLHFFIAITMPLLNISAFLFDNRFNVGLIFPLT